MNKYIENTNINIMAHRKEIRTLLQESVKHNFRSVVVFPEWVNYCKEYLKNTDIKVVQILNFPHQPAKVLNPLSDEIDYFIDFRMCDSSRNLERIERTLDNVSNFNKPTKIVIETHNLTDKEITVACRLVKKHGFAYIKSSTGLFQKRRKPLEDLLLIKKAVKMPIVVRDCFWIHLTKKFIFPIPYPRIIFNNPKIKISGGVSDKETVQKLVINGCSLIGTSKGVQIMEGNNEKILSK